MSQQQSQKRQKFPVLDLTLPAGRAVSGNFAVPSEKDYYGKDREKPQYYFAVAVSKQDPRTGAINQNIMGHAWHSYSGLQGGQGIQQAIQSAPIGARIPPGFRAPFAWKVEDGDAPENADREGWAGCWVYKFTSTFPIKCCDQNNNQLDPAMVQLGWFVEVSAGCVINGMVGDTASVYLNPSYVRVAVNSAPIIIPGKTAEQAFGSTPMQLPPGAGNYAPQQQGGYAPPQQQGGYAPPQQQGGYQPPQQQQGGYPPVGEYTPPPMSALHGAPASGQGAPAYAPQPQYAPSTAPAGYQGTAYPSEQPGAPRELPAGASPHPAFLNAAGGYGGQQ